MSKFKKTTIQVVVMIAIVVIAHFTYNLCFVQGDSMYPTLHNNQLKFSLKTPLATPQRDDIVTIKTDNYYIIKRVVGLPGETIEYKNGQLYIDGKRYTDKFASITEDYTVTLNKDEYCCLGDNRQHSSDSRSYGPFNKKLINSVLVFERNNRYIEEG